MDVGAVLATMRELDSLERDLRRALEWLRAGDDADEGLCAYARCVCNKIEDNVARTFQYLPPALISRLSQLCVDADTLE